MTTLGTTIQEPLNPFKQTALDYAARQWPVLPLAEGNKKPLTPNGFKDASTLESQMTGWWWQWPKANVGLRTGILFFVLDVDQKHDGPASLAQLVQEHGPLPATVEAISGGGGSHYYFALPAERTIGCAVNLRPGLDIRGQGGYIVAPPSIHPSGGSYSWKDGHRPEDLPLAQAPEWLLRLLEERGIVKNATTGSKIIPGQMNTTAVMRVSSDTWAVDLSPSRSSRYSEAMAYSQRWPAAQEGDRNNQAFKLAGNLAAFGITPQEVEELTVDWASKCQPPLESEEARKAAQSALVNGTPRDPKPPGIQVGVPGDETVAEFARRVVESAQKTDAGNASLFYQLNQSQLRYCYLTNRWLVWDQQRWVADDCGQVMDRAKQAVFEIYYNAWHADPLKREEMVKWAAQSHSRERINAMIELAKPDFAVSPQQLDADRFLLNVNNGTIDLRTGQLRRHRPEDLITKLAPVYYDPDQYAQDWERFLQKIFDGDQAKIRYVQKLLGMCLTGDISEQILAVFHGEGANGKSTLLDTILALMGDYAGVAPPNLLTERKGGDEHPTETAGLMGRRLVVASETEQGRHLRTSQVKRLTGEALITTRFMRGDYFTYPRTFKTILVTNNKPVIEEDTKAIWRRIKLVPFKVIIPQEQWIPMLAEKLVAKEGPGILNFLIEGCLAWQKEGLTDPEDVVMATQGYREESDPFGQFLQERCLLSPDAWAATSDLASQYEQWRLENGQRPMSTPQLTKALRSRGCQTQQRAAGRGWLGIGLRAEAPAQA